MATVAILGTLWAMGALASQEETRQEEIAEKGAQVMPFDLEETTPHLREDADRRAAEGGG